MLDKINIMLDDLNKSFNEGKLRTVHLCNVGMITNNFCLIELNVFTLGNPVSSHSLIMSVNWTALTATNSGLKAEMMEFRSKALQW